MENVPPAVWSDAMASGHPVLDLHHQHLLELCDRLELLTRDSNAEAEAFHALLDEIARYAEYHFGVEEALLKDSGFIGVEQHAHEHVQHINNLRHYMTASLKTRRFDVEIAEWVRGWWLEKIVEEAPHFRCHFAGGT
jgi:hemerythrin-like metal-binding protein